jgi:hypothetical protein
VRSGSCYHPPMSHSESIPSTVVTRLATLVACMVVAFTSSLSLAQEDQVAEANARYTSVPDLRRSDLILLPAVAKMDPPPAGLDGVDGAQLIDPGSMLWDDIESWATAGPQQAVIDALERVTRENDIRRAMVFAQPYGTSGVDRELIRAGLYTELGDPPQLAGARIGYLEGLENLLILLNVEATRLAASGTPGDAIDLMVRQVYLGRQIVDRSFFIESAFGFLTMIEGLSRIRDIAYVDFRGGQDLSPSEIARTIEAIDGTRNGYLAHGRILFPNANKLAAEQLWELLYEPRGNVKASFANTMARLRTSERPLRLFAEASRYESAGDRQGDWYETRDMIDTVFDGWSSRWTLNPFDRQLSLPYAYDELDRGKFSVIAVSVGDMSVLYDLRRVFDTEVVGTRASLALLGYYYELGEFPPAISSVRPRWLDKIEADPFNPNRAVGRLPALEYFVPVRDDYVADETQSAQPHKMNVFSSSGENFSIMLREDQFVVYSVGRDGIKNLAEDVSVDPDAVTGDYLIWPPMLSLERTHLRETNRLP